MDLHEPKGITTAVANSVYVANGSTSGSWTVPVSPGIVLLSTVLVPSAVSQVDFVAGGVPTNGTGTVVLDDTYDSYQFRLSSLKSSVNDVDLYIRVGTGGGPTYQTGTYTANVTGGTTGVSVADITTPGLTAIPLTTRNIGAGRGLSTTAGASAQGFVDFSNPELTTDYVLFRFNLTSIIDSTHITHSQGSGFWPTVGAITAIRFIPSSGNITSGRISLYGFKKS